VIQHFSSTSASTPHKIAEKMNEIIDAVNRIDEHIPRKVNVLELVKQEEAVSTTMEIP
jgi:hypothetical protein